MVAKTYPSSYGEEDWRRFRLCSKTVFIKLNYLVPVYDKAESNYGEVDSYATYDRSYINGIPSFTNLRQS